MKTQYEQLFGQMQHFSQQLKRYPRDSMEYAEALEGLKQLQAQEQQMRANPSMQDDVQKAMGKISMTKQDGVWDHTPVIEKMGRTIPPAQVDPAFNNPQAAAQSVFDAQGMQNAGGGFGLIENLGQAPDPNSPFVGGAPQQAAPSDFEPATASPNTSAEVQANIDAGLEPVYAPDRTNPSGEPIIIGYRPAGASSGVDANLNSLNSVGQRYGQAAQAAASANPSIGSGGAGFDFDEKSGRFVRR